MATPVKPGARNDLYALREARRYNSGASVSARRIMDELRRMREQSGRPDYSRIGDMVGELAIQLSDASKSLEEMWTIRQAAGQTEDRELLERRVEELEATVTFLQGAIMRREESWTR